MSTILIAGGYGAVGSKIARQLRHRHPASPVIIAGRNLDKARAAATEIGCEARSIDLGNPTGWDAALEGVDIVVVCIDQEDTRFVEAVAARGVAYVDVTAGDDFFRKVERLGLSGTAVLSVGLAPGLSNLLAISASGGLDRVDAIDIGLLMGTGDEHGSAAIAWSTAQMFDPDAPRDDRLVDFGPAFGMRKAYFMDFADQHVLRRTLDGVRATTRVTYDSALLTSALFWAGRQFSGNKTVEALINRVSHLPTFGSDQCILSVTATGMLSDQAVQRTVHFFGRKEATVTAAMAVAITEDVMADRVPPGVHHSHMLADTSSVLERLEKWGHGTVAIGPIVSRK